MIVFDKEGETPLDDISGLIPNISTRSELDVVESDNILDAFLKYTTSPAQLANVSFDTQFLQKLHKEMFGKVWTWAGTFRTTQTSIGIEATNIREALYRLMDDLTYWEQTWDNKDTAVKLHYTLVNIHPFPNGNGRCGRLFTDLWISSRGEDTIDWGEESIDKVGETRTEYIKALQEVDSNGYERLKHFMFQS